MPLWLIWIIIAAGLAIAETISLDFVLIMLAGGAAVGAITAAAGAPAAVQVAAAIVAGLALLAFVRPIAKKHLISNTAMPMHTEALVGKDAIVTQTVNAHDGRVRLNGSDWSARCFDETQIIPVGTAVRVMKISGATAVVWQDDISKPTHHG